MQRRYQSKAAPGGVAIPFTALEKAARFAMWRAPVWVCGPPDAPQQYPVNPTRHGGPPSLSTPHPLSHPSPFFPVASLVVASLANVFVDFPETVPSPRPLFALRLGDHFTRHLHR